MATILKDDEAFDALDGISELFREANLNDDNDIMNVAKKIPKKKVPYSKKKKVLNKKKFDKGSKIDFNKDTKIIDKKILKLLEERRNIQRMRARKEHGDPNSVNQGKTKCRHYDSRGGCEYGRQCNMNHPPIFSDVIFAIIESFTEVINAKTEDQVAFLERNKKRPQQLYREGPQSYSRERPQFYSRGKSNSYSRGKSKYKGKYNNTEKKSDD